MSSSAWSDRFERVHDLLSWVVPGVAIFFASGVGPVVLLLVFGFGPDAKDTFSTARETADALSEEPATEGFDPTRRGPATASDRHAMANELLESGWLVGLDESAVSETLGSPDWKRERSIIPVEGPNLSGSRLVVSWPRGVVYFHGKRAVPSSDLLRDRLNEDASGISLSALDDLPTDDTWRDWSFEQRDRFLRELAIVCQAVPESLPALDDWLPATRRNEATWTYDLDEEGRVRLEVLFAAGHAESVSVREYGDSSSW